MKNENNIGSNENDRENVNIMKENEHPADTGGGTPGEKKLNDRRIILYLAFTFILTFAVEIFVIMPMAGDTDINKAYMAQLLVAGVCVCG